MAGSTLRTLAVANLVEGCVIVLFQLAMLITLHDWVDWICIGFWGGALMVLTGLWALQKNQKRMIRTAGLTIFSGLCLVGFYSWHVSTVDCNSSNFNKTMSRKSSWEEDSNLCDWRLASDIIFIIFGLITVGLNIFLAASASSAIGERSRRHSSSAHHGAAHQAVPPVQHTTYVTSTPGYPPHAQPAYNPYPSNPAPQQGGYPPYPHQTPPPYNPSYPAHNDKH